MKLRNYLLVGKKMISCCFFSLVMVLKMILVSFIWEHDTLAKLLKEN